MSKSKMQELLQIVAEKNGVSVDEVAKEIEANIIAAYEKPTRMALAVSRKNAIPTFEEIMDFLYDIIIKSIPNP